MRHSGKKRPRSVAIARPVSQVHGENAKVAWICIFLIAIVSIVFGQTLRHEFINYDDEEYISENPHVLNGLNWPDLKWAFTTGYTGYAHPVTWLTHQLDYQLFGAWAGGHHLTSLILHAVDSALLFLFFWRTTRNLWPSAFVGAVFAVHPLHVESVAWVAERKDLLSSLFFLLTLHAYVSYVARPQASRYVLTLGLFTLGILSKPTLVTMPCVLLLLDYWPLRRMTGPAFGKAAMRQAEIRGSKPKDGDRWSVVGRLALEKIPFAAIAGVWSILTFILQGQSGSVAQARLGIDLRIGNAILSYAIYLWKTLWPQNLALFYPYPPILPWGMVWLSAVVLILVSILCLARRKSSPYLIVGWLWYLGMLVPVIGLVQVGEQARADRYTYLPQIGLCILATWGFWELSASWRRRRELFIAAGLVIITALLALSCVQTSYWRNNETLWNRSLARTSNSYLAENNLGNHLLHKGKLDEAIGHFRTALQIFPNYQEANNNLGYALANKGQWGEAIPFYEKALRVKPDYVKAHNNLGVSLAVTGKTDEALAQFREALRLNRYDADTHANLGHLLLQLGRRDEAAAHLSETLRLNPNQPDIREQLRELGLRN